jgi:HK97 family phage portal protein
MGILDLFRSKSAAVRAPRAAAPTMETLDFTDPRLLEYMRGRVMGTESGALVTPDTSLRVATAYRCVAIISSAVKTLPMDLKRRVDAKQRVDADDSPLWKVLKKKPNSWQTPSEFKQLLQMSVLLRGNGYALIARSFGEVKALIPLTGVMEVKQNSDLSLAYTYTRYDGSSIPLKQQDVFHLRGMSFDGITGLSVISYAREALGLSIQSEKHAAKLFKNGTSIAGVIEHPKSLGDDEIERLRDELERFRGAENAYKNLILEQGMKYNRIDLSAVDTQFVQNREMTQTEIAMFFGVPPHMLGLTNKTTSWGSGIEQQGIGFVAYTLEDWLTMWEEAVGRDLIPDNEPKMYCRFNRAGLVKADIKTRYLAYAVGRQWGWLSANDVLEKEDENRIDGGDTYLQAVNMVDAKAATDALAAHNPNDAGSQN